MRRPKLDGFTGLIDEWLRRDRDDDHRKQKHTAKRIFERLRDEHGFTGGFTIVKDYVREHHRRRREMYVPLVHPPGHGQADFGEAWAYIGGVKRKIHFFAFDLPQSDASYVRAYPAATAEAWVDGQPITEIELHTRYHPTREECALAPVSIRRPTHVDPLTWPGSRVRCLERALVQRRCIHVQVGVVRDHD